MDPRKFRLAFTNAFLAFLFLTAAYSNLARFLAAGGRFELGHLLLFLQLGLIGVFYVTRQAATAVSWHPWDVFVSFMGMFAPTLFSFQGQGGMHLAGLLLQIAGNALSIISVIALGRSFGILPANRGIQTGGMYRLVRHPLYASYQLANVGYLMNHLNFYNTLVAFACLLSQILRVYAEERLLVRDPEYAKYRLRVRWRLLPFVF